VLSSKKKINFDDSENCHFKIGGEKEASVYLGLGAHISGT